MTELGDYKNGYGNNDTPQVIGEIRNRAATILKDAGSKDDTLKTAQLVDHVMKIAKHEHEEPDPQLIIAGHSLVPLDTLRENGWPPGTSRIWVSAASRAKSKNSRPR